MTTRILAFDDTPSLVRWFSGKQKAIGEPMPQGYGVWKRSETHDVILLVPYPINFLLRAIDTWRY